jgi:hypothetical protein
MSDTQKSGEPTEGAVRLHDLDLEFYLNNEWTKAICPFKNRAHCNQICNAKCPLLYYCNRFQIEVTCGGVAVYYNLIEPIPGL